MANIYFAGSIRGGREDATRYQQIIKNLSTYGTVLTEHIADDELLKQEIHLTDKQIHDRDMEWLTASKYVVAEVTQASLGVGYELAMAMNLGKKVLCLFYSESGKRLSAMIAGQEYFEVKNYLSVNELNGVFDNFFESK